MQTPAHYQLFYSVRSPFARRVRVALQRLNVPFTPKEINVFEPTPEFFSANPIGLVPVLTVNDGKDPFSIPDSATILEFLHDHYGQRIWPADPLARAKVRAASTLAEGIMSAAVALFLESGRKHPSLEWEKEHEDTIERILTQITKKSVMQMPWKISDFQLTQAGYDLAIALDYLDVRLARFEWKQRWPELARFQEVHRSRSDLQPTAPPPAT